MPRWLWLSLLILLLDQATKQWAEAALSAYQPSTLLPFFDLTLMYNEGAAFSFLSDQGGWQRWFFIILALGVSAVLVGWIWRLKPAEKTIAVALSLIVGGAIGNVIDRLLFGHVIDFLHFHYQEHYWPAFNIADSAITVGVALMIFDALFFSAKHETD
ncbi:signal peptidase II [bacterium endosymbiont of Escarpia laminata]|nr:MAG: signal peptidase II [bacterium endosymbiont of Escarpia laminata]RLJ21632.1 MAG: signal peptidase II [bacterium endosymbiont of Escarpia laminata]